MDIERCAQREKEKGMTTLWHRISEGYKRWRHTRGYGVHSPYGYRLVKRVFHPQKGYSFYGEEELRLSLSSDTSREVFCNSLQLLRLATELNVQSAYLPANTYGLYRNALREARSTIHITSIASEMKDCELVCIKGDETPLRVLSGLLSETTVRGLVLHYPPKEWPDELFASLKEGVMFRGCRNTVIIPRAGIQKVSYTLSI